MLPGGIKEVQYILKINPLRGLKVFIKQSKLANTFLFTLLFDRLYSRYTRYMKQFEIVLCMREFINIHQILYGDL